MPIQLVWILIGGQDVSSPSTAPAFASCTSRPYDQVTTCCRYATVQHCPSRPESTIRLRPDRRHDALLAQCSLLSRRKDAVLPSLTAVNRCTYGAPCGAVRKNHQDLKPVTRKSPAICLCSLRPRWHLSVPYYRIFATTIFFGRTL